MGLQEGASATLAYAFDDSAIATVAASVGDHANAAVFRNRSTAAYKHLWSPKHQLLCPRSVTKGTAQLSSLDVPFDRCRIVAPVLALCATRPHVPRGMRPTWLD